MTAEECGQGQEASGQRLGVVGARCTRSFGDGRTDCLASNLGGWEVREYQRVQEGDNLVEATHSLQSAAVILVDEAHLV